MGRLDSVAFLLTPKFTLYVILGTFGYGLFWTSLPLLGWGSYAMEPFLISCSLNWTKHDFSNLSYMVATVFFCYVGHVSIMINCYRHISRTVKRLAQRDRERGRIVREDEMLYRSKVADDQQVTRMCFLVVVVFAGVWTPYALVSSVHIFYGDMPIYITTFPTMFAKAGCMMNPLVYFLTNRNFRMKAFEMFGCARMDNIVGVETPNGEVVRTFDKLSKDGIYLGTDKVVMEKSSTMF
ncbi:hypothetical protein RRG08_028263 [Elysia crispata]|uniref:G-protein coupled receptors family 1 profile domain-containing protein n=1 Tax=Elysia crispata TaxID=231223 RepID=A0AAE0ZJ04_9GAST|nr:hypothetical protein RRG08_028263 [Elysia crispata]